MKRCVVTMLAGLLLALSVSGFGQESNLLAKCLGEPLAAYGKAFDETFTQVKQTSEGKATVGDYKTGSARIEVIQKTGAKKATVINVFFYQQVAGDWKLALKLIGLPSAGITAKEDAKHHFVLAKVKTAKAPRIEAVYYPLSPKNPDGPELHLRLR